LIEGDQEKEIVVKDEWVFERKIKNENPNWSLIETKSL
jgi:predicted lipid-binding transport protein (Tim44 family)